MLKIENTDVWGFEGALRGMRNPMNSHNKSDGFYLDSVHKKEIVPGENDMELCEKLIKAGIEHRKFLRMIHVQCDVTAPLYWWKEMDKYQIGTVTNSCSTMHKIHAKDFTFNDFSCEHLSACSQDYLMELIEYLNECREDYLHYDEKKDLYETVGVTRKDIWWQMIQLLPSSYNQKRTIDLNYEVLMNIYRQRKGHKLDEWQQFREWIETLPCMKEWLR